MTRPTSYNAHRLRYTHPIDPETHRRSRAGNWYCTAAGCQWAYTLTPSRPDAEAAFARHLYELVPKRGSGLRAAP